MNTSKNVLGESRHFYYHQISEPGSKKNCQLDNIWFPITIKDRPDEELYFLNTSLIFNAVGKDMLAVIAANYMEMLNSSTAIYEKNGDCVLMIFSSDWCNCLSQASMEYYSNNDQGMTPESARRPCQNSCWNEAAKLCIETGAPVDSECYGGLHLYAVPVRTGKGEIVGSICLSYGDPPKDRKRLQLISKEYGLGIDKLLRLSHTHRANSPLFIKMAKVRLHTSARLIGTLVEREQQASLSDKENQCQIDVLTQTNKDLKEELNEQKRILQAFEGFFSGSPELLCIADMKGYFKKVNPECGKTLGYTDIELLSLPIVDFVHPEDRERTLSEMFKLAQGKNVTRFENRWLCADGSFKWLSWSANPLVKDSLFFFTARDITEQKNIEATLRSSEEHLYKAFNSNPSLIVMTSLTGGKYIDVNETWLKAMGFTREEVIGHTADELNTWTDLQVRTDIINTILEKGSVHNQEISLRTKWNTYRTGLLSGEVITFNGEQYLLKFINDITEIKDLEKETTRLDRLRLTAQMAAGVAHEIRNPLTTVYGFLQIFRSKKEFMSSQLYLELMLNELDRINSIISEFLSLSKIKPLHQEMLNLNDILINLLPMLQSYALNNHKNVSIQLTDIPDILLNENEINQLILNLVKNGLEAMSQGGTVTVRTYREDKYITLCVQDQGQGIKPEILERIGTPFLTTKEKGPGLGLAICFSIARRHNAIIELETGNNGSSFIVRFNSLPSLLQVQ